ncbi:tRNA (cytidine(34)-2'-O)-methyltransferase [uncultured Bartonella sp.]|uniref:tRNA (cytidine(34)-2'-O)-methyltransferase n=1 Tax=uncultured Bartonella sp. TaxID=104108 RepID=UPI0026137EFC|nr:tRNA (cytidine(34)-2'-O)-methyltransferase [uncultured Bartonella sp.]
MTLQIALFQPDIAGNTGTILRLGACLGVPVNIIEPAGFDLSDRHLKRAGMDYLELATLNRHLDWQHFFVTQKENRRRLVLFTTKVDTPYTNFNFHDNDVLLFGRESAGAPDYVHQAVDAEVTIPMVKTARSINLALSVAIGISEAMRQVNG